MVYIHPKIREVVTATAASGTVDICITPRLSTAALNIKGTVTFNAFAPTSSPSEITTLKI